MNQILFEGIQNHHTIKSRFPQHYSKYNTTAEFRNICPLQTHTCQHPQIYINIQRWILKH